MYSVVTRSSTVSRWLWHAIRALLMTILALAVRLENAMQTLSSRAQTFRTVLSSCSLATDIFSTPRTTLTAVQPSSWPPASTPLGGIEDGDGAVIAHACRMLRLGWEKCTLTATQQEIHNVAAPAPHARLPHFALLLLRLYFHQCCIRLLLLLSHFSRVRLCDPIPGILQARTLEWVAVSFSNA